MSVWCQQADVRHVQESLSASVNAWTPPSGVPNCDQQGWDCKGSIQVPLIPELECTSKDGHQKRVRG